MKRMITNEDEFIGAIEKLFSQAVCYEFEEFKQKENENKAQRKENVRQLSQKLNRLKAEIEQYKIKIREALAEDNKRKYGIHLNQLMKTKQELVKAYRDEKNKNPFAKLSKSVQTYACTMSLLQKYLMPAFVQSSPQSFRLNPDGSVTLNVELFENSQIYQQVQHIRDYVSSYIEHYPERVQGRRYFVGLHKTLRDFDELINAADKYFEELNMRTQQDNLVKSHEGFEVLTVYPEYNVQAVRLLNRDALAYEGAQMHHCVKTYTDSVEKGTTAIYSIRDIGDETTELKPHATIEYKEGNIKQIKGPHDSIVDIEYIEATRRLIMHLMKTDDFSAIVQNKDIPLAEKNNIEIYIDKSGKAYDILNISDEEAEQMECITDKIKIKDTRLKSFPIHKIKLRELSVSGCITDKVIRYLSGAKGIESLMLSQETNMEILDLSSVSLQNLTLYFTKADNVRKIILPAGLKTLRIDGDMEKLQAIEGDETLKSLYLSGKFTKLNQMPQIVTSLELRGRFSSLEVFSESCFKSLQTLKLSGDISYLPENIPFSQLRDFNISEGELDNVKEFDFTSCPLLKNVSLMNSRFRTLQSIKIPNSVQHFGGAHCVFDSLENIDVAAMPFDKYGTLALLRQHNIDFVTTDTAEEVHIQIPKLGGYVSNFSHLPHLKEIYFPQDIQEIHFTGMRLDNYKYTTLSQYKKLKQLNLQYTKLNSSAVIDLSQCYSLDTLAVDLIYLPIVHFPEQITSLNIRDNSEQNVPVLTDLRGLNELKELKCDFIPNIEMCPPSLEMLDLYLFKSIDNKEMDFSKIKQLHIKTSANTSFPNLEKILLAEDFNDVILFNVCPKLQEIDISHTIEPVSIREIEYNDEIAPGERNIYMTPEQFETLQKIKIGAKTDITLPEGLAQKHIILEIAADTTVEKEHELKQKYPDLKIQREQKNGQGIRLFIKQRDDR